MPTNHLHHDLGTATTPPPGVDVDATAAIAAADVPDVPEQLSLFPRREVAPQFRLDHATCARGLAHIAAIRRQLEEQAARRRSLDSAA